MIVKVPPKGINEAYRPYLFDTTRYQHYYGGSNSGKSVFVAQKLIANSFSYKGDILCIRKVEKTIKESTYKLIKLMIQTGGLMDKFEFGVSPAVITNKLSGVRFIFTGLDDPEKIKSIANIQVIWIEEATELMLADYLELRRRLRGMAGQQMILSYNPIDENHWIKTSVHNSQTDDTIIVKTTYLDNAYANEEDVAEFEYLRGVDEQQWRIYALGEWGILNLNHKFDVLKVTALETITPLEVIDGVKIFRKPEAGAIYSMGIDSSRGRQSGDYTSIKLRQWNSAGSYKDIASYKGKADEQQTFNIAWNLANYYNKVGKVYIVPEVNNMGIYLVNKFKESDYPDNLQYKRYIQDATKEYDTLVPDYGFVTSSKTRPIMINRLAELFHGGDLEVLDEDEKKEMLAFVWNPKNNRYEAQEGAHDDILFADMLAIQGFEYIARYG